MSRKRYECGCNQGNTSFLGKGNCCCDFPTLIILILIILQFTRRGYWGYPIATAAAASDGCDGPAVAPATGIGGWFGGNFQQIDNSILFIIALFFLSCCNPCKK